MRTHKIAHTVIFTIRIRKKIYKFVVEFIYCENSLRLVLSQFFKKITLLCAHLKLPIQ